jgi:hypothetical protein
MFKPAPHAFANAHDTVRHGGGLGQRRFVIEYDESSSTVTLDVAFDGYVDSASVVAIVVPIGDKLIVGNTFTWTEVVQWYANTYRGVHADNSFTECNVLPAGGDSTGALQAVGECYHGAGGVYMVEMINNTMHNSDGITVRNNAVAHYDPKYSKECAAGNVYGGNVSWVHWVVVRRNTITGISQAARVVNKTSPPCGYVRSEGGGVGPTATTDVIAEHNAFDCPSSGVGGGVDLTTCEHCILRP